MKRIIWCAITAMALTMVVRTGHAHVWQNVSATRDVSYTLLNDDEKRDMDQAIRMYLDSNPPETILSYIYSTVEKALPTSIPEADRKKSLDNFKSNITPDIMKKMIVAGLRRNFTVDEISVLSRYDDSQLSDELRARNNNFRREISSEIRLLLAAASG